MGTKVPVAITQTVDRVAGRMMPSMKMGVMLGGRSNAGQQALR